MEKLIGMEKPISEKEFKKAKIAQAVKVHYTDCQPMWGLLAMKFPHDGDFKCCKTAKVYFPKTGYIEIINYEQISCIKTVKIF